MATLNSTLCTASATPSFFHSDDAAYFYVDASTTQGIWVPLADVESWADVESALAAVGVYANGGDILCADKGSRTFRAEFGGFSP